MAAKKIIKLFVILIGLVIIGVGIGVAFFKLSVPSLTHIKTITVPIKSIVKAK